MNRSNTSASFDIVHVLLDIIVLAVAFLLSALFFGSGVAEDEWRPIISIFVVGTIIFLTCNRTSQIYNNTLFFYIDRIIRRETMSFFVAVVCGEIIYYNCINDSNFGSRFFWGLLVVTYVLILFEILIFQRLIDIIIKRKHIPRCVYVGSKDSYNKFRYFLKKTPLIVNEIGYVSYDDDDSIEYIGKLSDLEQIIRKYNIDQVYIMQKRDMDITYIQKYIDLCIEMGVTCRVVVDIFRRRRCYSYNSSVGTYPVLTYHTVTLNNWEKVLKRVFDIFFALFAIIITSPIMIATAIAIKLDSKGPAIFKQVRVGKNGRHFKIWKFRSMVKDAEELKNELLELNEVKDGMMFKMEDDPRVTKVGKFIRKTSIDELPQFFNVLAGSMSVVGTRPPTLDEVEKYSTHQWRRISIKPGITGMWQANGRSSIKDFNDVVELDVEYIDNWSPLLDIEIIFKTVAEVFMRKNSY